MALHRNLGTSDGIHILQAFEYADASARTGATGLVATDVGKVARQLDDNSFWVLVNHSPVTWQGVSGSGTLAPHALTHKGDGSDAIAEATDSVAGLMSATDKDKLDDIEAGATNVQIGTTTPEVVSATAGTPGSSGEASAKDHRHAVSVGSPVDVGTANQAGTGTAMARNDHVHKVPFSAVAAALGDGTPAGWVFKADGAGSGSMTNALPVIAQRLVVGKSGGVNYTSIKSAVDYAVSQGAGPTNVYGIEVYPGDYSEDPFTVPAGIVLYSHTTRIDSVQVIANNSAADLVTMTGGYICGFELGGVTDASHCLIRCATASSLCVLHGISVKNCSTGVDVSNGATAILTNPSINIDAAAIGVTTGFRVSGTASYMAISGGFFSVPSAVLPAYATNPLQDVFRVSGACKFTIVGATASVAYKTNDAKVLNADDGAECVVLSCEVRSAGIGAYIGSAGTGTTIIAQGGLWKGNYRNGKCDSSTGVFLVASASGYLGFEAVAGTTLSGLIQVLTEARTYLAGNVSYQFPTQWSIDFQKILHDLSASTVSEGGVVTAASGLNVDVSAGDGYVVRHIPYHDSQDVEWDAATNVSLTASATNYVVYDSSSATVLAQTSPPSEQQILFAVVVTDGSGIRFIHTTRQILHNLPKLINDYLLATRKIVWTSGLAVSQGTGNRNLTISTGSWYRSLDLLSVTGGTDVTFSIFYGTDGASEVASQTQLNNTQYDDAGTLTSMTASYYRADTVVVTSDGRWSVILGTEEFDDADDAASLDNIASIPSFLQETACQLALVVVQQGAGIDSIVDIRPTGGGGASGGGGSGNHSALSNLDKPGDHLWAMLVDGSRVMSGNLDMGGNAIQNVGDVDGVDVSGHASRHNPGGADSLALAAPTAVLVGASPSGGSATSYTRSDHQHGIAAGTPVAVGTANAAGSASSVARSDHVHSGLTRGANDFSTFTEKTALVDADLVLIEDSEASGAKKKVQVSNLPGGGGGAPLAAVQARRTTTLAMPTSWTDLSFDTTDVQNDSSIIEHLAGTPDRIQVKEDGLYLIIYQFEVSPSFTGTFYGRVRKNDTDVVVGSTQSSITYGGESDIISISVLASLSASDFLTVQNYISTAGSMTDNATFSVFKLNGTAGTPGSGSTIIIRDEGTPLLNTPHSAINFTGTGVTASDGGSGTAVIDIPSPGVFGTQAQDATQDTPASTTGTAWTQFMRLTTPVIPAGRYRIGWYMNWRHASTANDFRARVEVDDTTTVMDAQEEPQDPGTNQRRPRGGFAYINLTNAAHTIDLDFATSSAGTASTMNNAKLEIWRVS